MEIKKRLIELLEGAESAIYWNSDDRCFIEMVADHLIDNGVTVQKWISVAERMPDTEAERYEEEDGSTYEYEVSQWLWGITAEKMQVRVRYETGPVFQGWYEEDGKTWEITHWMPLPEPPRED